MIIYYSRGVGDDYVVHKAGDSIAMPDVIIIDPFANTTLLKAVLFLVETIWGIYRGTPTEHELMKIKKSLVISKQKTEGYKPYGTN